MEQEIKILLPCPWCKVIPTTIYNNDGDWYVSHFCEGDIVLHCVTWTRSGTLEDAIKAWNDRYE